MSGYRFERFMVSDFLSEYTRTYAYLISFFFHMYKEHDLSVELKRSIGNIAFPSHKFLEQYS